MVTKEQIRALGITALIVTAVVIAAIVYFTVRISARGSIRTVGLEVFADPEATQGVSSIDWGILDPGGQAQVTLYLKTTSNVPATVTLSTQGWDPEAAASYITLAWDYDETPLEVGEIRAVVFTLNVAPDILGITDFYFDIVITAAG